MERTGRFQIPKKAFWEAFKQSQKTKVVGVDGQTIQDYKRNRLRLLHAQWNQVTSGNYMPSPVRRAFIPKKKDGWRPIGIPTVKDFIVQTVLKNELSPQLEILFHPNSYGYKQKPQAREDAIRMAGKRCLRYDWALVLDVERASCILYEPARQTDSLESRWHSSLSTAITHFPIAFDPFFKHAH